MIADVTNQICLDTKKDKRLQKLELWMLVRTFISSNKLTACHQGWDWVYHLHYRTLHQVNIIFVHADVFAAVTKLHKDKKKR